MKKIVIVFLIGIIAILCVSCTEQKANGLLTPEQRMLLQNRTEKEIIDGVSDEPYNKLLSAYTDDVDELVERFNSSEYFNEKYTPEYLAQIPPNQVPILYRKLTLEDANSISPIQCLRKAKNLHDVYYAIYRTQHGCRYVFFGYEEEAGCYLAFDCISLNALPRAAETLKENDTLTDFYKIAPKYKGLLGENVGMLFYIEETNIIRGFHFTSEENKGMYGLPTNYDVDPNKVIISDFFMLGDYYEQILEKDYPKY